ncbi:alpha-amylase family glycosyl hydrolase [Anaerotalea alkaliphila]|uniref:Glycosyl hydrolase family 13 catalytic domain-containing protein n=1 Tax=Anaerotalea alkaliphila TaxID=2662126 RepID=A0A7X5KNV1_9FIRM|nr:alpha-amylase family glycosyl hydrolase [Anaerotalea alkaliphila]NDL67142.1 hypothetical protein [Anaerotalea alkaliphila]
MMGWKASVYSDGSSYFVRPQAPRLGELVEIRLRMRKNEEVKGVKLRRVLNGSESLQSMERLEEGGKWLVFRLSIPMNQPRIRYHFYIYTEREILFYNQLELSDTMPTEDGDFKLVAGYQGPDWVRSSVFYQIFPDRFCNGNPENDVRDGEYTFDGHPTVKMDWNEPPREYQDVFCLDFYGGDLEGVEQKIPYFQEMGFNALYLNPIFHSATSHRYDCLDYFRVDPHLGGDTALSSLTGALRREGMKVVVDVSINHTGTAHKWFNKENVFFPPEVGAFQNPGAPERDYYFFLEDNDYHKWYGVETLPTLNYTSGRLRDILYRREDSMVKKWLKPPYAIDGWRFDVANDMARNDAIDLSQEVWREIFTHIKGVAPQAYVLAEQWMDCAEYLQGDMWDSPMNYFGCARPIRQFVGEQDLFIGRDPDLREVKAPMGAEQLRKRILQHFGRMPHQLALNQFNLLDSHDTPRLHNNPEIAPGAVAIAVQMLFTLPGVPSVYYGDEVGLSGGMETVEGCRHPMEWNPEKWNKETVRLYRTLARLKRENPCLHEGGFKFLLARGRTVVWARFTPTEALVLAASMEAEAQTAAIPLGDIGVDDGWTWSEVLGKPVDMAWDPSGETLHLHLPAGGSRLLRWVKDKPRFEHAHWTWNANIYEVNIRQYTPEGTFRAFQEHLPRLKEMGVDILWLMPIQPIGRKNRKGTLGSNYSVMDYKACNPEFGTLEEFKALVDAAHGMGMRILLDWVANHTAWDHVWTTLHPEWYLKDDKGEIHSYVYDNGKELEYWTDVVGLDYGNPEVWDAMEDALQYWIRETDIDGYRCDVAGLLPTGFWERAREKMEEIKKVFLLAEWSTVELHEKAFDMTYDWGIYDRMGEIAKGEATALDLKAYTEKALAAYPEDAYRMVFTSNHDKNAWEDSDLEMYGDRFRTFAALAAVLPGMPLIYGGQESGLDKRISFFEKDPIDWKDYEHAEFYKGLLQLKRGNQALWNGQYGGDMEVLDCSGKDVFAFQRTKGSNRVTAVFNLSDRKHEVEVDGKAISLDPWGFGILVWPGDGKGGEDMDR